MFGQEPADVGQQPVESVAVLRVVARLVGYHSPERVGFKHRRVHSPLGQLGFESARQRGFSGRGQTRKPHRKRRPVAIRHSKY